MYKVAFRRLLALINVLQACACTRETLSLAVASITALTIILRRLTAKQTKLITDYAKVARKVNDNGLEFDEWDFIIVGGGMKHLSYCHPRIFHNHDFELVYIGTAGCVLASRLSDNPNMRVLLIEAGGR